MAADFMRSLIAALIMLALQSIWYVVAVRDDFRETKRDVRELQNDVASMRCDLAYVLRRPTLPRGCIMQQLQRSGP